MMQRKVSSRFLGGSMPLWFRATVAGLFALLFAGYWLLDGEGASAAFGRTADDRLIDAAEPTLRMETSPALRPALPNHGSYRVNGMLVRFNTYPVGDPQAKLREIEMGFRKLGYQTRRKTIEGDETVLGIHPKTKVMLSASATHFRGGVPALRLSQRNLGELKRGFKAELPGIPDPPAPPRVCW